MPTTLATLADYREHGYRIAAFCSTCVRSGWLDLEVLIARLGAGYTPSDHNGEIRGLLCSRCGSREVRTTLHPPER
jgi:hypothetical protein